MNHNEKIYIAGHRGLVGSALLRELQQQGFQNILFRTHKELDLMDATKVTQFFETERPDYVFLAAAKVGGIQANNTYPVDFLESNLEIQLNVMQSAYKTGVKRFLFLGSSCIYPKECPQPMKEEYLLTGPLEPTNRPYALAKIAGIEGCWAYNRQYSTQFLAAMPTNLYGPNDNYDLQNSHVLPALIRKCHEAKMANKEELVIWGTGTPRREFLYSDDLAKAILFLMNLPAPEFKKLIDPAQCPLINIGSGKDLTIRELAETVMDVVGFKGNLVFDSSKPDGTMKKLLDISKITEMGWTPRVELKEGIQAVYKDVFLQSA
jgi:GDP-L-fucose synthase